MEKQIEEMARVMSECCNHFDENGNHLRNKCRECEYWDDTNYLCCSCNTKEATALYNTGYRKQEWISVEERLPETSGYYYAHIPEGFCEVFHYSAKHKAFNAHDSSDHCVFAISVTHWMPLPEPPKGGIA